MVVVAAAPAAVAAAVAACEVASRTEMCFPAEISASLFDDDAVAAGKDIVVLSGTVAVVVEKQPVVVFPASASEN